MMKFALTGLATLICISLTFAQKINCDVKIPGKVLQYEGECKRGEAHGWGKVKMDNGTYEGEFKKGFPHGTGKWTFENGTYYKGEWVKGLKHGEGGMYYSADSIMHGFWENNLYASKYKEPYAINSLSFNNSSRIKILKTSNAGNNVEIRFTRGGALNTSDLTRIQIQNNSGIQNVQNGVYYIEDPVFPLEGRIDFTALNKFRTSSFNETHEFAVYEEGHWVIIIEY